MSAWTPRVRWIVATVLIAVSSMAVATTTGGAASAGALAVFVVYSLAIVGLVLGTVRLFQHGTQRVRVSMLAGLALGAAVSAIGVASSDGGHAVGFVAQLLLWMAVVDVIVIGVRRAGSRRGHGG